ncbi:DNA mismatch repair endonuclease MutL [bacterium]|nr:DNA mismatch repair endonuclease MutL [bacterium]
MGYEEQTVEKNIVFEPKKIQQLSEDLINKIAAGEVIDRPSAIVKELVENSIDAGATKIEVKISNGTRDIRVADNGCGIDKNDIQLAFKKHATSKIKTVDDLWNISSLGFRGEALASIVAVAKVTCTTRTKNAQNAIRAVGSDSVIEVSQVGAGFGTTFDVKDLFFNTPARLKFMKSDKTEFAAIQEMIQAIALSNPKISFELFNNDKSVLKTTGTGDLFSTVYEIFKISGRNNLVELNKSDLLSKIKITGVCSNPDFTRPTKKNLYIFVNGRSVKCPVILKSIDTAYKRTLPIGKYPFVVLNLEIPFSDVDVNVHPTKRELRYRNPNQIFNIVYSAIDMAISNLSYKKPEIKTVNVDFLTKTNEDESVYIPENYTQQPFIINKQEPIRQYSQDFEQTDFQREEPLQNFVEMSEPEQKDEIIGQYANTYIMIQKPDGLEIVDQHIAHERFLYEQLLENKDKNSQILLISEKFDLTPTDVELLNSNKALLQKFGYDFEIKDGNIFTFKKIPQMLTNVSLKELLANLLDDFQANAEEIENKILTTTACKAAVKANTKLNIFQMKELIANWRTTKNWQTCPHGRPISVIIPHKKIASFFLRQE